jgi:hypothetical protein
VTGGLYRVIRHPNYLGLLLGLFGWALVFHSGVGVLVALLLLLPPLVAYMNSEEALFESEFGERYSAYRRRTRRLPFLSLLSRSGRDRRSRSLDPPGDGPLTSTGGPPTRMQDVLSPSRMIAVSSPTSWG